jgi:glucokinase
MVRSFGERGEPMALKIFEPQTMALGRLLTIAANYFYPARLLPRRRCGRGDTRVPDVVRERVREHTHLREEQARVAAFSLVPDVDMAGAGGSALAAFAAFSTSPAPG